MDSRGSDLLNFTVEVLDPPKSKLEADDVWVKFSVWTYHLSLTLMSVEVCLTQKLFDVIIRTPIDCACPLPTFTCCELFSLVIYYTQWEISISRKSDVMMTDTALLVSM